MRKNILFGLLFSIVFATISFSNDKAYDSSGMLDMYYKKGLESGAKNGYDKGYKDGIELAKKRLRLYSDKIKANESGKYLKEYGGKITNPEIYQIKDGNSINVIVKGCKIEKQLTPDEIIDLELFPIDGDDMKFKYYNMNKDNIALFDEQNPTSYGGSSGVTNSVDVFENDNMGYMKNRPSLNNSNTKYMYLPNSNNLRTKLTNLNYTYSIENDRIKVIYGSEREKDLLLKQINEPVN